MLTFEHATPGPHVPKLARNAVPTTHPLGMTHLAPPRPINGEVLWPNQTLFGARRCLTCPLPWWCYCRSYKRSMYVYELGFYVGYMTVCCGGGGHSSYS